MCISASVLFKTVIRSYLVENQLCEIVGSKVSLPKILIKELQDMGNAKCVVCCYSCPYKHLQEPNTCGFRADSYPL